MPKSFGATRQRDHKHNDNQLIVMDHCALRLRADHDHIYLSEAPETARRERALSKHSRLRIILPIAMAIQNL